MRTGTTTDTFSQSVSGTGTGQTRYVAAGFWQRQINGTNKVDGRFTAAAYGVLTAATAVPLTGGAGFDLNLVGAHSEGSTISALRGNGKMLVDFGLGVFQGGGTYSSIDSTSRLAQTDLWRFGGRIVSGKNLFSGSVTLNGLGRGPLTGAFFGPAANEVGGAFSFAGGGNATAGAFIGWRNGAILGDNTTFSGGTAPQFFPANGVSISATIPLGTVISNRPIIVNKPVAGSPVFATLRDGSGTTFFYADGTSRLDYGGNVVITDTQWEGSDTLVKGGGLYSVDADTNTVHYDAIVFGVATPPALLPRTGFGYYRTKLMGGLVSDGEAYSLLTGTGTLTADFAGGAITTAGQWRHLRALPNGVDSSQAAVLDQGTWLGTGAFGSGNRSFSGTIRFDGVTDYRGTFEGRLFGRGLGSIGATLALTSTGGARGAAAFVGRGVPFYSASYTPLDSNQTTQQLPSRLIGQAYTVAADGAVSTAYTVESINTGWPQFVGIGYAGGPNPLLGLYAFDQLSLVLKTTRIDAAASDAARQVYVFPNFNDGTRTYRNATLTRYVFDGLDDRIKLTYTDLAAIIAQDRATGARNVTTAYLAFGNATPFEELPKSGRATYRGILIGRGVVTRGGTTGAYELSGATTIAADFTANTVNTTLAVKGKNLTSADTISFGQYVIPGHIEGVSTGGDITTAAAGFTGSALKTGWSGGVVGIFNGPKAQEAGGTFALDLGNVAGSSGSLTGAFAARKP